MEPRVLRLVTACVYMIIVSVLINGLFFILGRLKLTLTHLGSGVMKADGTEQLVFEFERAEPFQLHGWINLKNLEEEDEVWIRQYHRLAVDGEFSLYAKEKYEGKQEEPLVYITPKTSLRPIRITIQQTKGKFKYFPWEFYLKVT